MLPLAEADAAMIKTAHKRYLDAAVSLARFRAAVVRQEESLLASLGAAQKDLEGTVALVGRHAGVPTDGTMTLDLDAMVFRGTE